jgi:hypothetical protein
LPKSIERIADVAQGVEALPVLGKGVELRLHDAQLAFEGLAFLPDPLDLLVQWLQFLS